MSARPEGTGRRSIETHEPIARRRRRLSLKRQLLLCFVVLVLGTLARISVAPLELPVAGLAERAIRDRTGLDVTIGSVALGVGLGEVRVVVGDVAARAPGLSATVARIALRQGTGGRDVGISGLVLRVDPKREGPQPALPPPGEALAGLDRALGGALAAANGFGLTEVRLDGSRFDVVSAGRPVNEARVFQDVAGRIGFGAALTGELDAVGAGGPIRLDLARRDAEGGGHVTEIAASGVVPADLGPAGMIQSGFALAPRLVVRAAPDGTATADLGLTVGAGTVVLGRDPIRAFDGGRMDLALAPDGRAIAIRSSEFSAGRTVVPVTGTIAPPAEAGAPWTFDLAAPGATFDGEDIGRAPVTLTHFIARGRIDPAAKLLSIDQMDGEAPGGSASMILQFDFGADGPRMSGAAHVGPSSVETLLGAWPAIIAHEPRMAVANAVKGGAIKSIDVVMAMRREDLDGDPTTHNPFPGAMSVDAEMVDGTLGAPDLPVAVRRARGALRLRDRALSVRLDAGVVSGVEGGDLKITDGAFTIPDMALKPPTAEMTGTVAGPVSAVVGLATAFDIKELKATKLTPADVAGTVRAAVAMVTPLGPAVTMAERRWSIEGMLNNVATKVPVGGQTFTDANVQVQINSRRLAARGRAKIDGLSVDVNYSELFSGERTGAARVVLTDKDRRDRGFDTGDSVRGPVTVTLEQGEDGTKTFEADLTEAEVAVPGFAKAAGRSLVALGTLRGEAPDFELSGLEVEGAGASVAGSLSLQKSGLKRAEFTTFALSEGDRARVSVGGAGNGYRVDVEAAQFDLRSLVKGARAAGPAKPKPANPKPGPALTLTARGERVRITDAAHVSDLSVEATHDGKRLQRLAASGRLDGVNAGSFGVRLAPSGEGRRLQADVAELGRLLATFDVYERMRGGRATVDARMNDEGGVVGRLSVGDFQLADERTLEDLIARTQRSQLDSERTPVLAYQETAGGAAPAGGLAFDQLVMDFEKRGDKVIVSDAILRGRLLGGTATGEVDLAAKTVTLNGTLIPAFGVNNLFGRMPVVGTILGAGREGGLIGVTFRLEGPLANPKLSWNPLSAVAPGIFRRIFEYR